MIRLAHPDWHFVISFHEHQTPVLVLENPVEYRRLVAGLLRQTKGQPGRFVLSRDWTVLSLEQNMVMVSDVFSLGFTDRKLLNGLAKHAQAISCQGKLCEVTAGAQAAVLEWMACLETELLVPIAYDDEPDVAALLKAVGLRFDEPDCGTPEALDRYIQVMTAMTGTRVFAFVNLMSAFSAEEMDALAKAADYRKVHLLLIEPLVSARPQPSWERRYVVDKDLCELYPEEDNRAY